MVVSFIADDPSARYAWAINVYEYFLVQRLDYA
jgi:hypothetical protein